MDDTKWYRMFGRAKTLAALLIREEDVSKIKAKYDRNERFLKLDIQMTVKSEDADVVESLLSVLEDMAGPSDDGTG